MGGVEKMAEDLTVIQDKGKSFRQSIVSLLVQWRDFEGQFNLADKVLNFSASLESREKDLEQREKDILLFVEKKKKFLELKEEKLIKFMENYAQEVEKNFMVQEERGRGLVEKLESKKLEMVEIRNFVEKRLLEMGERENHLVSVQDSLERKRLEVVEKENMCKERAKEVESKVEELNLMIENVEFKEKQVDYIRQIYENQLNDLNMRREKLENKFELSKRKVRIEDLELNKYCARAKVRYSRRHRVKSFSEQEFESGKTVSSNIRWNDALENRKKERKNRSGNEEQELRSEESKVTLEKETHKRGFNFKEKEVEESSKKLQQQYFSYHSRNKYPQRTMQYRLGTFHDPPYRNYPPRRFNGTRRR